MEPSDRNSCARSSRNSPLGFDKVQRIFSEPHDCITGVMTVVEQGNGVGFIAREGAGDGPKPATQMLTLPNPDSVRPSGGHYLP